MIFLGRIVLILLLFTSIAFSQNTNEKVKIDSLLIKKRNFNRENATSEVYKIQLYNGTEKGAFDIKRKFETEFPEYKAAIVFKTPEWKTQVGNYLTRLEADRVLLTIRKKFPSAIVLKDTFKKKAD